MIMQKMRVRRGSVPINAIPGLFSRWIARIIPWTVETAFPARMGGEFSLCSIARHRTGCAPPSSRIMDKGRFLLSVEWAARCPSQGGFPGCKSLLLIVLCAHPIMSLMAISLLQWTSHYPLAVFLRSFRGAQQPPTIRIPERKTSCIPVSCGPGSTRWEDAGKNAFSPSE